MDINYREHLPTDFAANSRVWVYQSSRKFSITEALQLEGILKNFLSTWHAHGDPVKGYANLFFGQFIIIMADETSTVVSGCSTDSSVQMIREIEKTFNVELFNRTALAFIVKDKIESIPYTQINYALEHGFINKDTLYFNNTINNKKELEEKWLIPVKESWLKSRIPALS